VIDLAGLEEQFKPLIDNFQKKLSEPPDPKIVKTMQGFKYIPVEIIEAKLDKYYSGLWKTENLKYSIEINSVAVSLDLHVFHPVAKNWIVRTGIASVPVQLDRETKVIKQTALQKNLPAAKAIAFKNAAQSLGRSFGRNLNRGFDVPFREDTYNFKDIVV
jgi:hypothetical protein